MMVFCYLFGQKYYPVPYDIKSAIGYISAGALIIYIAQMYRFDSLGISVAVHMLTLLVLLGITFLIEKKNLPALRKSK